VKLEAVADLPDLETSSTAAARNPSTPRHADDKVSVDAAIANSRGKPMRRTYVWPYQCTPRSSLPALSRISSTEISACGRHATSARPSHAISRS